MMGIRAKKRGLALWLALLLLCPAHAEGAFGGRFADVHEGDWYASVAEVCAEEGILTGDQNGNFLPDRRVSPQEGYALLARLYGRKNGAVATPVQEGGDAWWSPYLTYCIEHRIVTEEEAKGLTVLTRKDLVRFLARIYPPEQMEQINDVSDVPDCDVMDEEGQAILGFYRAGILQGRNRAGFFGPHEEVSRAECGAILARLMDPSQRIRTEKLVSKEPEVLYLDIQSTESQYVCGFDGKHLLIETVERTENGDCTYIQTVTDLYGKEYFHTAGQVTWCTEQIYQIFYGDEPDFRRTYAYCTKDGQEVARASQYDTVVVDQDWLIVQRMDGTFQIINARGEIVDSFQGEADWRLSCYFDGEIQVGETDSSSQWLDFSTKELTQRPYRGRWVREQGKYLETEWRDPETKESRWGLLAAGEGEIFPCVFESITVSVAGAAAESVDGNVFFVWRPGEEIRQYVINTTEKERGITDQISLRGDQIILDQWDQERKRMIDIESGTVLCEFPERSYRSNGNTIYYPHLTKWENTMSILTYGGRVLFENLAPEKYINAGTRTLVHDGDRYAVII